MLSLVDKKAFFRGVVFVVGFKWTKLKKPLGNTELFPSVHHRGWAIYFLPSCSTALHGGDATWFLNWRKRYYIKTHRKKKSYLYNKYFFTLVWCWWGRVEMSKYSFDRWLANTSKKGGRFHNLAGQPMTLFSKKNKVFPDGTSRVPVCALCLLSCPRTPLSEVSCLCTLLPGVGTWGWDPTLVFSSPGWTVPGLLAFPHRRNASVSSFLVIIF